MSHADIMAVHKPLWVRLFYLIPVIGWIARDTAEHGQENLYYGIGLIVSLWAISGLTFGFPGLVLPAIAVVPAIFATLIVITWG
jgi:hypothetical protein